MERIKLHGKLYKGFCLLFTVGRQLFAPGVILLSLVCFAGCATSQIPTTDWVSPDMPKGYVYFYNSPKNKIPEYKEFQGHIFKLEAAKKTHVGHMENMYIPNPTFPSEVFAMRRVALVPGKHSFIVEVGDSKNTVEVVIKEGMITPVRIDFINIRTKDHYHWLTFWYRIEIVTKLPVPFNSPGATQSLIDDLEDSNWDVRWFAAFLLAEVKDPKAIGALEKCAMIDSDPDVRLVAREALQAIRRGSK